MCFERLVALKCGHYESYKLDQKSCMYSGKNAVAGISPRACPDYKNLVAREDKGRSCGKCKALKLTGIGVASASLRAIRD